MTRRTGGFVLAGIVVALLLAGGVSRFAADSPDGLEAAARHGCTLDADGRVTGGTCIAQSEREHELSDGPLADYGLRGRSDGPLATGLAGVVGVLLTFALGGGLFYLLRRRRPAPPDGG